MGLPQHFWGEVVTRTYDNLSAEPLNLDRCILPSRGFWWWCNTTLHPQGRDTWFRSPASCRLGSRGAGRTGCQSEVFPSSSRRLCICFSARTARDFQSWKAICCR